jgi:uroporphyrinogen-III synthase
MAGESTVTGARDGCRRVHSSGRSPDTRKPGLCADGNALVTDGSRRKVWVSERSRGVRPTGATLWPTHPYGRTMPLLPLEGFTIGVTADRRAEEQCEMLRRRGALVVHGPSIRTVPLAPDARIRAATEALIASPPEVVLANTGIGVRSWFAAAESWGLGDELLGALSSARILARGPKAAGAILTAGLVVAWRSPMETLREAVAEILATERPGTSVAVQLDGNAEQHEIERLRAAGYRVTDVRVYEWHEPTDIAPAVRLLDAVCDRQVDAVTFTSAAALKGFVTLAGEHRRSEQLREVLSGPVLAMCVGPMCAGVADDLGLRGLHPKRPRLGAMVHHLVAALSERQRRLRLAGTGVVLQGSTVLVDDLAVTLTEQERAIVELLVSRNGAVVSRRELTRAVWGNAGDPHAVEVAIARVRKKLGAAGPAVRTVVRRGYRLEIG